VPRGLSVHVGCRTLRDYSRETIDLIGSAPARMAQAQTNVRAGALSIRSIVSSKPLAFAAGAAPMGIQWRFGAGVLVGACI